MVSWILISPSFGRDSHSFNKYFLSICHAVPLCWVICKWLKRGTNQIWRRGQHYGKTSRRKLARNGGKVAGCDRKVFQREGWSSEQYQRQVSMVDLEKRGYYVWRAEFKTGKGNAMEIEAVIESWGALSKLWQVVFVKDGYNNISHPICSFKIWPSPISPSNGRVYTLSPWTWVDILIPETMLYNAMHFCLILWGHLLLELSHHAVGEALTSPCKNTTKRVHM